MSHNSHPIFKPDQNILPAGYPTASSFIKQVHPISEAAAIYVDKHTHFCKVSRNTLLHREGEVTPYIYILLKGAMRGFARDGHKEVTTWITIEGEMVTSISSFFSQLPSFENIQAIEDSEMIWTTYEHLSYLYDHFPEMNIVGRKLLEGYYRDAEHRALIARLSNATKKYTHFLETKPKLVNRIPLKYIASFLGITLETLSRLRSQMAKS